MVTLKKYWSKLSREERAAFAEAAETSPKYLSLIARGWSKPSPRLAKRIHRASGGEVAKRSLRPDIWE